ASCYATSDRGRRRDARDARAHRDAPQRREQAPHRGRASSPSLAKRSLHPLPPAPRVGRMPPPPATLPEIVFTTPRSLPDARKLRGRVAVVDIAFAADGMGT